MEHARELGLSVGVTALHAQRLRQWARPVQYGLFAVAPVLIALLTLRAALAAHSWGVDFVHGPWAAGHHLLAGAVPYGSPHSPALRQGLAFVYPAAAAVAGVPFALLPQSITVVLFTAINIGAVLLALRLCDVRDWRVCGAVFLWLAVISGLQTENLTLLLVLGVAAMWRWRDHPIVPGVILAVLVSLKPFLWPLAFWLLATRRFLAFGWSVVVGAAVNLLAWDVVGFDQFGRWLKVVHANASDLKHLGYGVMTLVGGNDSGAALAVALALAAVLLVFAAVAARRHDGDRGALALCLLAALVASPLVWLHYFALLMVPLALARPRLSAWWLLPVVLWFPITSPRLWQVLVTLGVCVAVTLLAVRPSWPRRLGTPWPASVGWGGARS